MDAWEIFSLGDISYLAMIYRGVAMFTNSNSMVTLGLIGFLICAFLIAIQGILTGGRQIPIQHFLVAGLLWACMFQTPKTNVALVDAYTGETVVVSDIPLGVAVPQAMITQLGRGMSNIVESAFSYPGLSDREYGSTLHAIVSLRNLAGIQSDPIVLRFQHNAAQYLQFCARFFVNNDPVGLMEALNSDDALNAARADHRSVFVPYSHHDGSTEELSCADAFGQLRAEIDSDSFLRALDRVQNRAGINNYADRLDSAYTTLLNSQVDAGRQMRNIVMMSAYNQAIANNQLMVNDPSVAAMMEAGIWQRNIQWAAEGDWFTRYARPMIGFIEAVVVALTPFVVLLVATGVGGALIFFSYLKMTVWIQLWFPLLAIINLFLVMSLSNKMTALTELANLPVESINGTVEMISTASIYLATAAVLTSAVAALSYALLSKSPVAFTHLMGRLQGADTADEKILAPSVVNAPPVMSIQSPITASDPAGVRRSGLDGEFGTYAVTLFTGSSVTEAQTEAYKATEGFQDTILSIAARNARFGQAWSNAMEMAYNSQHVQNEGRNISSSEVEKFNHDVGSSVGRAFRISDGEHFKFGLQGDPTALLNAVGRLSSLLRAGQKAVHGPGSPSAVADKRFSEAAAILHDIFPKMPMSTELTTAYLREMTGDERDALAKGLGLAIQNNASFSWLYGQAMSIAAKGLQSTMGEVGLSETDQHSLQKSASELFESTGSWQEARQSGTSGQIQFSGSMLTLAQSAAQRGEGYVEGLVSSVADAGLGGLYNANLAQARNMGVTGLQGRALAAIWTMSGQGHGIQPMNEGQIIAQKGLAGAFANVVSDLRGRSMAVDGPAEVAPAGYGANIGHGQVAGAVTDGISPGNIPARGVPLGAISGVAQGSSDIGALKDRVLSASAPLNEERGRSMLAAQDWHERNQETLSLRQSSIAAEQYDAIAQYAANVPTPGLGEDFVRGEWLLGQGGLAGDFGADYNLDEHIAKTDSELNVPGLGAGLAAGYYARKFAPEQVDTFQAKFEYARDALRQRGYSEDEIRRVSPMIVMGLKGHTDPRSQAVKGVAEKIIAVDRLSRN